MSDLISRCELFNRLAPVQTLGEAYGIIQGMETVDAVSVRCKDCKFFSHGYCRFHDAKFVRQDGYCYWGEQKEGDRHETN